VKWTPARTVNVSGMKRSFIAVFALCGLVSSAAAALAQTASAGTIPTGAAAFYIVQGPVILSPPYPTGAECLKALAKIKRDIAPGKDTLACAHRRP
jgi:hypothetical protein